MNTLTLTREQSHPPIALTSKGLVDRAAIWFGIGLIRWARRSELVRSERASHRRELATKYYEAGRLRTELADERARVETHMLFRALQ